MVTILTTYKKYRGEHPLKSHYPHAIYNNPRPESFHRLFQKALNYKLKDDLGLNTDLLVVETPGWQGIWSMRGQK